MSATFYFRSESNHARAAEVLSSELADKAMLDRVRTSRALTGLEVKGWVQRKPLPVDADSVICVLQHGATGLQATFTGQSGG